MEMLMLALHWAQRSAEALAVFDEHCTYLETEVAAAPSARLRDIGQRIRAGNGAPAPAPAPPLPPADRAVADSGGRLDIATQPSMALYGAENAFNAYLPAPRPYHTAKSRAGVRSILAVAPGTREIQKESIDLVARLTRALARRGISQFIEFGGLPPAPLALHEVVRLPCPDAQVVYFNADAALGKYSQQILAEVPGVECEWGTLATFLRSPQQLIDLARPVVVVNLHEVNQTPPGEEYRELYAELGALLAPGSHLLLTAGASEGLSSAIPWTMKGAYRTAPEQMLVTRTAEQLRSLIPPGFTVLDPGVTDTWRVWEVWAGQPNRRADLDDPLPTISVVAVKD